MNMQEKQFNSPKPPKTTEQQAQDFLLKRIPPHSVEAEQAVLGGIILRPELMFNIVEVLQEKDFYLPAHQIIYGAFLSLFRKSITIELISAAEHMKNNNQLEEAGGAIYLSELAQVIVSGANAEHYAGIVRDKSLQRSLIGVCSNIIGNCYDSSVEVKDMLEESEQAVFAVAQSVTGKNIVRVGDVIKNELDKLEKLMDSREIITGVTTGFAKLDDMTSGLQASDLIILAARPSMGKTAFALCLALNAAIKQNVPVVIYSLEMPKEQLIQRMIAVYAKIDASLLRRPYLLQDEDWARLHMAVDIISNAPIFIDDTAALNTLELKSRTRRLKAEHGVGMVIVDYLQLMRAPRRDSRELEISEISRSLKALAKEMQIPVVALSQLNRKVEERSDKRPMLSDLRESGAIEQDADIIMFVYRDDVYKFTTPAERPAQGIAEIIIGKHRNGPVGTAELLFTSKYTSFENLAHE